MNQIINCPTQPDVFCAILAVAPSLFHCKRDTVKVVIVIDNVYPQFFSPVYTP